MYSEKVVYYKDDRMGLVLVTKQHRYPPSGTQPELWDVYSLGRRPFLVARGVKNNELAEVEDDR